MREGRITYVTVNILEETLNKNVIDYLNMFFLIFRYNFIKHKVIPALAQLLNDPVDICRWNMHYGLKLMSEAALGMTN